MSAYARLINLGRELGVGKSILMPVLHPAAGIYTGIRAERIKDRLIASKPR